MKSRLPGKDPDAGKDWRQKEEGDDRGWDGWMASPTQWTWVWANCRRCWRSLVCCSPWGLKESDKTEWLNNNVHTLAAQSRPYVLFPNTQLIKRYLRQRQMSDQPRVEQLLWDQFWGFKPQIPSSLGKQTHRGGTRFWGAMYQRQCAHLQHLFFSFFPIIIEFLAKLMTAQGRVYFSA